MSVIFNGTEVTDIVMDGVDLDAAIFNGEIVFGTWVRLLSGHDFNEKLYKKLFNLEAYSSNLPTNLKRFSKGSSTIPSDAIRVDTQENEYSVYVWANISNISQSNITQVTDLYWYSDADIVLFNSDCSEMFAGEITATFGTSTTRTVTTPFNYIETVNTTGFDAYYVESMVKMFYKSEGLKTVVFSAIDTDNVTDMSMMYRGCTSLIDPGISNFSTLSLQKLEEMFINCNSLESLDFTNFDFSNVTSMHQFCYSNSNLVQIDGLNNKKYTKLVNAIEAFNGNAKLKTLNFSNSTFDILTDIENTFRGCNTLETLNLSNTDFPELLRVSSSVSNNWLYNTPVTSLLDMENCNMPKLSSAGSNSSTMFRYPSGAVNLKNAKLPFARGSLFESSRATSIDLSDCDLGDYNEFASMFSGCIYLVSLDLSFLNIPESESIASTASMFSNCTRLTKIYVKSGIDLSGVSSSSNMFNNCTSLVGGQGTTYDSNHVDAEYARIDDPDNSKPGYFTEKTA